MLDNPDADVYIGVLIDQEIMQHKRIILAALLTALCVTIGFLFMMVPNVELFTAAIFVSGFMVGGGLGMMVGGAAALLYSSLNPMGMAAPPLMLAQVLVYSLVGQCGGTVRRLWPRLSTGQRIWLTAAFGLLLTALYDVLTTLSFAVFITDASFKQIIAVFISGALFYAVHMAVNTLIFATVVPLLLNRLPRI